MTFSRCTLAPLALMAACSTAATGGNESDGGGGAAGAAIAAGGSSGTAGATIAAGGSGGAAGATVAVGGSSGAAGATTAAGGSSGAGGGVMTDGSIEGSVAETGDALDASADAPISDASPDRDAAPAACLFGKDFTCNDDNTTLPIKGLCQDDGTCYCLVGYAKNPDTGRCVPEFKPTLPPPCVTVDDCCVTSGICPTAVFLVGKNERDALKAWLIKTAPSPPICTACIPPEITLQCVGGFCTGTFTGSSETLGGDHCGALPPAAPSDAGLSRQPLSAPPAADAGTKTSWGCSG